MEGVTNNYEHFQAVDTQNILPYDEPVPGVALFLCLQESMK